MTIMGAPHRFELVPISFVNKAVISFHRISQNTIKSFSHAGTVNMSTKRVHFTLDRLCMNNAGKNWITSALATKFMQIFTTRKPKPSIFLTWLAETNEEDRKERNVDEGRNSRSQESSLNKKLTGNNKQCTVISVSDSMTSTGGKDSEGESESEGDELKHRASKRTKKNT